MDEENERCSRKVLAHALRGNVLWSVVEITALQDLDHMRAGETTRYIACDLLEVHGGRWGYKGMDESSHPYYYTCPLKYLDLAEERCPEWRRLVRKYHEERKLRRACA